MNYTDESFINGWQLLNRLFNHPLEAEFVGQIVELPVKGMPAPEELGALLSSLKKWMADPQVQDDAYFCYQRLFIGPDAPPAPPWGSVYLTEDKTVMGPSTLAIRKAFCANGLELQNLGQEPDDHFAHCCAFLVVLGQNKNFEFTREFLEDHFLTWAPRFLELMLASCNNPVYADIASYAIAVLNQAGMDLKPATVKMYM